jgi:orotidine-5'-phosphate decarboxylase
MTRPLPWRSDPPRIIVALDFPDAGAALALADRLDPSRCRLKVGKELFTRTGPALVSALVDRGFGVFLDLKFHDIPNTVAGACRAAADLGVWMMNVHASGGRRMLEAARRAVEARSDGPLLVAVTVLTSLSGEDLQDVGITASPLAQVLRLARLTADCGLDGVVCSPLEVAALDAARPEAGRWVLVTPGIRPAAGTRIDDQRRTMSPAQARGAGSDFLVIGRPITQARDPVAALSAILAEIDD